MPRKIFSMPKLALAFSALFLLGSTSACSTSGTSEADKSTTTVERSTTSEGDGTTTTVDEPSSTTISTPAGDDADAYAAALAENLASGGLVQDLGFTADQAECVANEWVDIIGVGALQSNDVASSSFGEAGFNYHLLGIDEEQATNMVGALDDCGIDWIAGMRDGLSQGLDLGQQQCLDNELTDETLVALLVQDLYMSGPSAALKAEFGRIEKTCEL